MKKENYNVPIARIVLVRELSPVCGSMTGRDLSGLGTEEVSAPSEVITPNWF